MSDDQIVVAELSGGRTIVSVLSEDGHAHRYQVLLGEDVVTEADTIEAIVESLDGHL